MLVHRGDEAEHRAHEEDNGESEEKKGEESSWFSLQVRHEVKVDVE